MGQFSEGDEHLLSRMSGDVAAAMRKALELLEELPPPEPVFGIDDYRGLKITASPTKLTEIDPFVHKALELAGFPSFREPIPLASDLTSEQRAVVELLASRVGISVDEFAVPSAAWVRRTWLGLEPCDAIEQDVTYCHETRQRTEPLWRAIRRHQDNDRKVVNEIFASLPLAKRLEAFGYFILNAYGVEGRNLTWGTIDELTDEGREWATAYADWLLALFAKPEFASERAGMAEIPNQIRWPLFLSLVRSGIEIKPLWDELLPMTWGKEQHRKATIECLNALPNERRGPAIAKVLALRFPGQAIRDGLSLFDDYPSPELTRLIIEQSSEVVGSVVDTPRREILESRLAPRVRKHPDLEKMLRDHLESLPPRLDLRCKRVFYPAQEQSLSPQRRKQLVDAAPGLGLEIEHTEDGSFSFGEQGDEFVTYYEIVDAEGNPIYEAILWMEEDGWVLYANTTKIVASVCQGWIELDDEPLREALHEALRARP